MESSDSQLRSPGVLTGFGARVLDQLSNRPVPLGAGAADVGATDFGSTSEPDTLMVLSPPVGFALVESVTSATANDPPSTPDDNAGSAIRVNLECNHQRPFYPRKSCNRRISGENEFLRLKWN